MQNRNVLRCFLKVASVDAFLISDGSSFQSRGAATLNARLPNLNVKLKFDDDSIDDSLAVVGRNLYSDGICFAIAFF